MSDQEIKLDDRYGGGTIQYRDLPEDEVPKNSEFAHMEIYEEPVGNEDIRPYIDRIVQEYERRNPPDDIDIYLTP